MNPETRDAKVNAALTREFGPHCGLNADWRVTAYHVGPANSVANRTDGAAYLLDDENAEDGTWTLVTRHYGPAGDDTVKCHVTFHPDALLRLLTASGGDAIMPTAGDLLSLLTRDDVAADGCAGPSSNANTHEPRHPLRPA